MPILNTKKHFSGVLCLLLGLVMLFSGLLIPGLNSKAQASNSYISDIHFYKDSNGYIREHFYVDQTFTQSYQNNGTCWISDYGTGDGYVYFQPNDGWYFRYTIMPENYVNVETSTLTCPAPTWTPFLVSFTAGNSYDVYFVNSDNWGISMASLFTDSMRDWTRISTYKSAWDPVKYEYDPNWSPITNATAEITFPTTEQTITEIPLIPTGSWTNPGGSWIRFYLKIYDDQQNLITYDFQNIYQETSGTFDITFPGSSLPNGHYTMKAFFTNIDQSEIYDPNVSVSFTMAVPVPSITIAYPPGQQTISSSFNITGSFIDPIGIHPWIQANFYTTGTSNLVDTFSTTTGGATSGTISIPVSGLGSGNYTIKMFFRDLAGQIYDPGTTPIDISINVNIPPQLPGGETPPVVYQGTDPAVYYTSHSQYTTSTPLYNALSGSLAPVIGSIGENLSFFSSRFELSDAQATGSNLGNAILVAKGYATNINQLLGNLPIAQMLVFYLALLILVGVFRLVKNLINMIKP